MEVADKDLTTEFIHQAIFRLHEESIPRLLKCVGEVSHYQLWYRSNENSNSIGNLVLHLTGNVNQWINTGLGGDKDSRQRQAEFDTRGGIERGAMLEELDIVMKRAKEVISGLSSEDLVKVYKVQGFEETGMSIVIHVVEHFSYHVGQMTYIVKSVKDIDTGYYSGKDLSVTAE